MNVNERRLLQNVLSRPTAPFREHYVRATLEDAARRLGLRPRRDRFGNLYIHYRRGNAEPLALGAHMDHPGFEIQSSGRRVRATLLGGVDPDHLRGVRLRIYGDPPELRQNPPTHPPSPVHGRIVAVHRSLPPGARRPQVEVEIACRSDVESHAFAHFDLPGMEIHGGTLRSKALDNLLSCVMILATFARLRRRRAVANVLGVFTRAEEVGFVGAGGVLRSRVLTPSRPLVVLETSKALPGAPMDAGPVLRVGDRMTCFDPEMDLWLADCAANLARQDPRFAFQRALMTGGACEASLFQLHRRRVGALAMPLGNYHNMTPRGGIGAEFVSIRDFDQALLLLEFMAVHPPQPRVVKSRRTELDAVFQRLGSRLLEA